MSIGSSSDVRELLFGDLWEYSPAPVTTDHLALQARYGHVLQGVSLPGTDHRPSYNPADDQLLYEVPTGNGPIVERAVAGARAAAQAWSALPGIARARHLYRLGRRLTDRARDLALYETLDTGRPVRETLDVDVPLAAAQLLYCAGWADKLEYVCPGATGAPRPLGVVGLSLASDRPLLSLARSLAPALAAGNTVVVVPAENASLTALQLAHQVGDLGWPEGVVNVVLGGHEPARDLAEHVDVDAVVWDGPADELSALREATAGTGRRLLVRGDEPTTHLILADAPLDEAVESVVNGMASSGGCRLFVQETIFDLVLARLRQRVATLRVGAPLDRNTDVGPLPTRERRDEFQAWVDAGQAEGAHWHALDVALPERGCFARPGVFTGVAPGQQVATGTIPGPAITLQTFRTPDEALSLAPSGPATAIWTDKGSRFFALAQGSRADVVWGNTAGALDPASPAGGVGGMAGLAAFLHTAPRGLA